jgi:rhodanese-related sulfurtransferase
MIRSLFAFAIAVGLVVAPAIAQRAVGTTMSVTEAHAKALAGEIVLVDVRTPDEWKETGVPASAHAITMHQEGKIFVAELQKALGNNPAKPLAIICRTGNRTSNIYAELQRIGFKSVINVAEGVAGGPYGPGWQKTGLPLRQSSAPRASGKP